MSPAADPQFASTLRSAILRLSRQIRAQRLVDVELTANQMSALGALARHGPMTVTELAAYEQVKPPSITRTINCMVESGLVERSPHPTDGRQVMVGLTPHAEKTIVALRARRDAWLEEKADHLSATERDVLRRALPVLEKLIG